MIPDEIFKNMENVTIDDARTPDFGTKISGEIETFQKALGKIGFDFGFRVINEILRYMYLAWDADGRPLKWSGWANAFDTQIVQKMIPKIHGSAKSIHDTLKCLYCCCFDRESNEHLEKLECGECIPELWAKTPNEARYVLAARKFRRMQDSLETQRYVSFT
jgi:hypothetical protein